MTGRGGGHPGSCGLCGGRLKRNGTTSAGTTRWRCTVCGASSTKRRPDLTRRAEFDAFLAWLLGPTGQAAAGSSARTFRRRTAWCWLVEPTITVTGEVYDEVQIDGIYLSSQWCCLIASNRDGVIAWQWCDREKTAAWKALLEQVPPPTVVVCDGGSGLLPAVAEAWPNTKVQRCLVHVQRNVRIYLTAKPRTDAGKALWALARSLTRITTSEDAVAWLQNLNDWHAVHGHLTRERTHRNQLVGGRAVPAWIRPGQQWWYTHDRLRKAYRLLARLAQRDQLFTYLASEHDGLAISSTTNRIEGGINAGLRDLLRRHRGMPEAHQRRAVEWWLHAHAIAAPPAASLIKTHLAQPPAPDKQAPVKEPLGPAGYDTGLTADEGLWHRRGWAGRS
jgi:hypothetical protein